MTIYLENICKSYNGKLVLDNFTVSIEWGKCYVFVGPEGAGKSTILKIFMGTEKPDAGEVHRMGDYKYPTLQSAYVAQECQLNLKKDAVWNVRKAHRWASKTKAIAELSKFLAPEQLNVPVSELSAVEQRLVEIVKASFVTADFIVMDEPFAGMDEALREKAMAYIMNFRGSRPLLIAARERVGDNSFVVRNVPVR